MLSSLSNDQTHPEVTAVDPGGVPIGGQTAGNSWQVFIRFNLPLSNVDLCLQLLSNSHKDVLISKGWTLETNHITLITR